MIHTYTARINVCSEFYSQFISHPSTKLYKERGSVHQTAKNGLLSEIGITLYGHKYNVTYDRITAAGSTEHISYINYVIDARVNPSKVIYREKSIDIYKARPITHSSKIVSTMRSSLTTSHFSHRWTAGKLTESILHITFIRPTSKSTSGLCTKRICEALPSKRINTGIVQ